MCKERRRWADKVWKVQMMRYIQNVHNHPHTAVQISHLQTQFLHLRDFKWWHLSCYRLFLFLPTSVQLHLPILWVQTCHQKLIEHDIKMYTLIYYNCIINLIPKLQISIAYIITSTWKSNRNITFKIKSKS